MFRNNWQGRRTWAAPLHLPSWVFSPLSSLSEEQDLAVVSKGSVTSTEDRASPGQRHRAHLRAWTTLIFQPLLKSLYFHQLFANPVCPNLQLWKVLSAALSGLSNNSRDLESKVT